MPSTTALGALPIPLDADPLADDALAIRNLANALDRKKVRKSADQGVPNSAVLVTDTEMQFPVAANKNYMFDFLLIATATNATPDIKTAFTFPAGGKLSFGVTGADPAATAAVSSQSNVAVSNATSGTVYTSFGLTASETAIRIRGTYKGGGTAGTVALQYAQATATAATTTTVKEGSLMEAEIIP